MSEGQPPDSRPPRRPLPARLFGAGTRAGLRASQTAARATGLDRELEVVVEDAVVRALESPATERALARALSSPVVEQSIYRALDSETTERIWQHLLDSDEVQRLVERIAQAPEVRAAIAYQGVGLLSDLGVQVRRVARRLDSSLESVARRLFRRPRRAAPSSGAGVISRALALALDVGLLNVFFFALSAATALVVSALTSSSDNGPDGGTLVAGVGAWLLFGSVYLLVFWSLAGQTPGMRVLAIRLSSATGPRLGLRRAFRRLVGLGLGALTLGLGFLTTLFDERRRGIQDRFADTEVVYLPERAPALGLLEALGEEGLGEPRREQRGQA